MGEGAFVRLWFLGDNCLAWISGNFPQDEVSYVESFEFYSLIVVFRHLLLVFCHFAGGFVSYFVQIVQVKP